MYVCPHCKRYHNPNHVCVERLRRTTLRSLTPSEAVKVAAGIHTPSDGCETRYCCDGGGSSK